MKPSTNRAAVSRSRHIDWAPIVVLALSLVATGLAGYSVWIMSRARDEVRFQTAARSAAELISERLTIYGSALLGGAGLFAASEEPIGVEFRRYAARLDLQKTYPGIQGFGFARRTLPEEKEARTQAMRREGEPGFEIRPPGERSEYFPIVWLEPMDRRNRQAIGYDMFSEAVRQEAMARARDEGRPIASGKVTLVQEIDEHKQSGFLLYVPVYKGGTVPAGLPERRERLQGFVYSPFRADDLFAGIFGEAEQTDVHFEFYDGTKVEPGSLLHRSPLPVEEPPSFSGTLPLVFGGHNWTLKFRTTPHFEEASYRSLVPWVVGVGALVSLILAGITAALARAHRDLERAQEALKDHAARLEETVAARTAELRETVSELEHMSYSIVHDMRAPLRAIQSFGGMLDEEAGQGLNEECRGYVHRMQAAARRMDALIRDVLNYGRMVREDLPLSPVDVPALVRSIVETYPAFGPESADIRIDANIPRVLGNEAALTQCFSNLLDNAVKFVRPRQQPRVQVSGLMQPDGWVRVCVADDGIGIPGPLQQKIFGMFQRLDHSYEGTGMGLAIVRKAVERMGGRVEVESGPGQGARFFLVLKPAVAPRGGDGEGKEKA